MQVTRRECLALALPVLAGCTTGYGPRGLSGGYSESRLGDNSYLVSFQGNGNTSGDTVWYYWIHRCAELTLEKGYTAFSLRKHDRQGAAGMVPVRGGGAPVYIYTPPVTITTWTSQAVVTMHRPPYPGHAGPLLDARLIVERLRPYVQAGGKAPAPGRRELVEAAVDRAAGRT